MFLPRLRHAFFPFIPSIIIFFSFSTSDVRAQFRFDNLLEGIGMEAAQKLINGDTVQQNDPLRNVFGIWGRLLNRMAQKSPPSDDELHLKGAQEGDGEDGNVIGDDPEGLNFPPRGGGGGFGGGSAKSFGGGTPKSFGGETDKTAPVGPNRIIDEQRLNELLPRLSPNYAKEEKHSPETTANTVTTETTTEAKMTSTESTTLTPKAMTTATKDDQTTTKFKKNKRKKKPRTKDIEENVGIQKNMPTMANLLNSSLTPTMAKMPMNEKDEKEKADQKQQFTKKVGATIQLRTSADEKRKGQMELIKEGDLGLNETVLERAVNETAQLIAEIENVLADAELGPNGHWLKQQAGDRSTTTTATSWSSTAWNTTDSEQMVAESTTMAIRNGTSDKVEKQQEEASYEEDEGTEMDEEQSYETDDSKEVGEGQQIGGEKSAEKRLDQQQQQSNSTMDMKSNATSDQQQKQQGANMTTTEVDAAKTENTTTTTAAMPMTTTAASTAIRTTKITLENGTKKWIPEAEEEDQHQQIIAAQLQLDPAATVSSVTSTTQQLPQSAQNVFNLNANSNAYANPNFTNVMKPVNSIIDGIGPLILPLIGYSQRAFDAYAPLMAQRAEGLPIFRPPAMMAAMTQQQQIRPLIPIGTTSSSDTARHSVASFPSQQSPPAFPYAKPPQDSSIRASPAGKATRQMLSSAGNSNQLEIAHEAPSLEMLGRIIEESRQNGQHKNRRKSKGSADEQKEINGSSPPDAELAYFPPNLPRNSPAHPFDQPVLVRPSLEQRPAADRGYDSGRQTVHNNFHEDSGVMMGTQQTQNGQKSDGSETLQAASGGFGNGKRPKEAFGITRR